MTQIPPSEPRLLRDRVIAEAQMLAAGQDFGAARAALRQLEFALIDDETVAAVDRLITAGLLEGRRLVATCDPARQPAAGEHVIIYGNYPHFFGNVRVDGLSRRHVSWFGNLRHDAVESHAAWNDIGAIFIINMDGRPDRLDAVLNELARARAPLDRVVRVGALSTDAGDPAIRPAMGCLMSHLEVLQRARDAGARNVLVLEDDFCFTSDLEVHLAQLSTFMARDYDYWICLLATSKQGLIVPFDELLCRTFQACTNTGAYLISTGGIAQLIPVWQQALAAMIATGDLLATAADRAWAQLQPSGKFFVFRDKLGFQASSYSDIEGRIARYFD